MIPQGRFPQPTEVLIPVGVCSLPPACMLCGQAAADLVLWGHKVEQEHLCAHLFCLIFASKLCYWQDEESGQQRFIPEDIPCILERVVDKQCFVCGESGAAITCCREGCDRSFHLPCAMEGECVTQYFLPHRSFCREHRPEQEVEAAPDKDTTCIICRGPVEDRKSFHTMVCPICREAWFHQGCIQYAGTIAFRCPVCRDQYDFLHGMLTVGIRIPGRLPSWDNGPLDEALMERHSCCDTCQCLCPGGREQAEERGPWELLLCSSCAAEGTHRRCANLSTSRSTWECGLCPAARGVLPSSSARGQQLQPPWARVEEGQLPPGTSGPESLQPAWTQTRDWLCTDPILLALIPLYQHNKVICWPLPWDIPRSFVGSFLQGQR
uniref:PHD finger protein 7 n=1 Tax=Athene cunicularia TaxID=194338 RepID=A0A663N2Q6_ATHCN